MAIEVKSVDVKNEYESESIRLHQDFGWTFKSSQRVFNQNTRLENRNDGTHAVTETVDFTKLVFERDTNMKNYDALKRLDEEYFTKVEYLASRGRPKYTSSISIEDWAKQEKPDCSTDSIFSWAIALTLVSTVAFIVIEMISFGTNLWKSMGWLLPAGFIGFIFYKIANPIAKTVALNKALKNIQPYRQRLEGWYNKMREDAEDFEKAMARVEQIREEVAAIEK
ncbi:MAG: hypothetical protein E7634_06525 [Ruminococcaceae bacterium]|nr:hypothetical protein [Oscillospiraceae bacterium]